MSLEFDSLPLIQVSAKLVASQPIPFNVDTLMQIREGTKEVFPLMEQSQIINQPPGRAFFSVAFGSPIGLKLSGTADGVSALVQSDMIEVSWASPNPLEPSAYPRFNRIKSLIEHLLACWQEVSHEQGDFDVASMAYTNMLKFEAWPTVADLKSYAIIDFGPKLSDDKPLHSLDLSWKEDVDTRLDARITCAISGDGSITSPHAMALATTAGCQFEPTRDPLTYLILVHDYLQSMFGGLITDRARKEWGLRS